MFSILIAIAFGYFTISAIFNPIDDRFLFLILGPPLTALMIFGAIIIFWTKLRVSKEGVEYRGVKGWEYFSWDQIKGVDTHAGLGPRINTINNRRLYFWPYGYGLEQLREIFVNHDKPFNVE